MSKGRTKLRLDWQKELRWKKQLDTALALLGWNLEEVGTLLAEVLVAEQHQERSLEVVPLPQELAVELDFGRCFQ